MLIQFNMQKKVDTSRRLKNNTDRVNGSIQNPRLFLLAWIFMKKKKTT